MRRALACVVLALALGGCPTYDRYGRLADQQGYKSGDQFAGYGPDQAQKVAIGRTLAQALPGTSRVDDARQVTEAVEYARTLPDVVDVKADSAAYFLTVTFRSGWRAAVLPETDGQPPEATPGLPAASK